MNLTDPLGSVPRPIVDQVARSPGKRRPRDGVAVGPVSAGDEITLWARRGSARPQQFRPLPVVPSTSTKDKADINASETSSILLGLGHFSFIDAVTR